MTLDDLCRIYVSAYDAELERTEDLGDLERAGIRAVVTALRDEIYASSHMDSDYFVSDWMNEILASDGGDKAGGSTRKTEQGDGATGATSAVATTTPAAAPVRCCWWTVDRDPDGEGHYETQCQNGWTLLHGKPELDGYSFCPSCGKPISFKEAAR